MRPIYKENYLVMAKIPFSIDYRPQIESGEYKVVIYMGNSPTEECSVEILKWDSNSDAGCIVGCFQVKGKDKLYVFDKNGEHKVSGIEGNRLFIITPEPELTDWQKFISGCLQKYGLLDCGAADRIAKECSAELLELARKEFVEEQYISNPRDTNLYKLGKTEALKDLPKWRKIGRGSNYSSNTEFLTNGRYLEMTDTLNNVFEVALSELEKLPKEYETQ